MARYQPIKDWPEEDRPREKLLDKGAESLTEAEVAADQVAASKGSDYLPRQHLALSIRSSWLVFAPY